MRAMSADTSSSSTRENTGAIVYTVAYLQRDTCRMDKKTFKQHTCISLASRVNLGGKELRQEFLKIWIARETSNIHVHVHVYTLYIYIVELV